MLTFPAAAGAAVALFMLAAPAFAENFTPGETRIIEVLAEAVASDILCKAVKADDVTILAIMKYAGIDLKTGTDAMYDRVRELTPKMAKYSEDMICSAALKLYGPQGSRMKDLMQPVAAQ